MRRLLLILLLVVLAILLIEDVRRPLLNAAGRFLVVQDPLEKADVIIVLSGGRRDERVRQAADLYHQGYAPLVLLSGGEEMAGISVPEMLRRQALALGIPPDALLSEPDSTSTAQQARYLRPLLEPIGEVSHGLHATGHQAPRSSVCRFRFLGFLAKSRNWLSLMPVCVCLPARIRPNSAPMNRRCLALTAGMASLRRHNPRRARARRP